MASSASIDARAPVADLARRLNLSRTTVQSRIERLERRGVIVGYAARLSDDYERGLVRAHVMITVRPKEARAVEVWPNLAISGSAQWAPARTAIP